MLVNLPKFEDASPPALLQFMGERVKGNADGIPGTYIYTGFNAHIILEQAYGRNVVPSFVQIPVKLDNDPDDDPDFEWPKEMSSYCKSDPYRRIPYYGSIYEYGVCDSPRQLLSLPGVKQAVVDDPDKQYMIVFTSLVAADQPPQGGWRWHKWGPYVGDQNPQCEYLYDEPEIELVYVYHIYDVTKVFELGYEQLPE